VCSLDEALDALAQGSDSFARATRDARVYTCKHLNFDLDETTRVVPSRAAAGGWIASLF
jgi:hypothetical protein